MCPLNKTLLPALNSSRFNNLKACVRDAAAKRQNTQVIRVQKQRTHISASYCPSGTLAPNATGEECGGEIICALLTQFACLSINLAARIAANSHDGHLSWEFFHLAKSGVK
jgi:hypothetical protein